MLRAGHVQQLTVSRISEHGLFLADEEQQEVLLPNRYVSLADKVGDTKEVFVYHDSEDRLVATTETPLLKAGEAGYLKVVDKTEHGAFLDWGLYGKDLFLPNRNQQGGVLPGRSYIVYLYEDNITGRCVATMKLKGFINNDIITVAPRQAVHNLSAATLEGLKDVAPVLGLFIGLGMCLNAMTATPTKVVMEPLLEAVIPTSPWGFTLFFFLLAPLALYRGPLNMYGLGAGVAGILLGSQFLPPTAILAAFFSVGQVQGVCDPTNTQNVWLAQFTKTTTERLLKDTLPYVWAFVALALLWATFVAGALNWPS